MYSLNDAREELAELSQAMELPGIPVSKLEHVKELLHQAEIIDRWVDQNIGISNDEITGFCCDREILIDLMAYIPQYIQDSLFILKQLNDQESTRELARSLACVLKSGILIGALTQRRRLEELSNLLDPAE